MDLSPLIHANIKKASTNVILCSKESLTGEATVNCPFERFHELQRSRESNAYNAIKHDTILPDVTWKLISKKRRKYEKIINILGIQAVLLGMRWLIAKQRARVAQSRSESLAAILLHVIWRPIRGFEVMEIKPAHRCSVSAWEFEDRSDLGRK